MHPRENLKSAEIPPSPENSSRNANVTQPPLVALVGSANSGKTTLFNLLTGSHYTTVNYPGATVEFAIGTGKSLGGFACRVMDTPGLTSLIPASLDEKVTVDALFGEHKPALVIAVVDANQLSRHLYLVKQLQDLGFKTVIALTMSDLLAKRAKRIDTAKLSELMDCPVLALDPRKKSALAELAKMVERKFSSDDAQVHAPDYQAFAAGMNEDRVHGYYRALDEIEQLVTAPMEQGRDAPQGRPLDKILLHPFWGLFIFLVAMFAIFTSIFWLARPFMDLIDASFGWAIAAAKHGLPQSWITDLFADGFLGGIGAVLVFLPQILILFFAMGYLEDSGYLARGAALVDKPLSKIGLNGKSFVPLLSGYACAIPAMMAARTIPNRFERNLTIFIIPLMSCSARLPVYTLLLGFITPREKPWVGGLALTGLYLAGITMGAIVSTVVSKLRRNRYASGFILELPALRRPVFTVVVASTYHKAKQYIQKAGLTIVVISLGLWVLTHTPVTDASARPSASAAAAPAQQVSAVPTNQDGNKEVTSGTARTTAGSTAATANSSQADPIPASTTSPASTQGNASATQESAREYVAVSHSYAAQLGRLIEPVTRPMGLDWRGGVAMICGFAAREVFVSAMALMYRIDGAEGEGITDKLMARMTEVRFEGTGKKIFTVSSVLGIILFFMIALQCFPTVAVSRHETAGWKLPAVQLLVYTGGAYLLAVILVQGLRAFGVP